MSSLAAVNSPLDCTGYRAAHTVVLAAHMERSEYTEDHTVAVGADHTARIAVVVDIVGTVDLADPECTDLVAGIARDHTVLASTMVDHTGRTVDFVDTGVAVDCTGNTVAGTQRPETPCTKAVTVLAVSERVDQPAL